MNAQKYSALSIGGLERPLESSKYLANSPQSPPRASQTPKWPPRPPESSKIRSKSAPKTPKSDPWTLPNPKIDLQDPKRSKISWPKLAPRTPNSGSRTLPNPKSASKIRKSGKNPQNQVFDIGFWQATFQLFQPCLQETKIMQAKLGPQDPQIRTSDPPKPQHLDQGPQNQAKFGLQDTKIRS